MSDTNVIAALADDSTPAPATPAPATPSPTAVEATKRTKRTLIQGAVITAVVAIAGVVVQATSTWTGSDVLHAATWEAVGGTAVVSGLHAVATYVAAKVSPPQ